MAVDAFPPRVDPVRSLLSRLLAGTFHDSRRLGLNRVWVRLRSYYGRGGRPVCSRAHGRKIWLNPGNLYPLTIAEHPRFNSGLIATAHELHAALGRPLRVIDVGAAIGDTVMVLDERCPRKIGSYLSIDGDAEFARYFALNTADIAGVAFRAAMLAATETNVPELERYHAGTATATGGRLVPATTLDRLLEKEAPAWDLLKIDVDGFDGEVLAGARRLLRELRPAVYFEWHPRLIRRARNDESRAFAVLEEAGYSTFLWFTNRGSFTHVSGRPTIEALSRAAVLAVNSGDRDDHFDVLALPAGQERLAQLIATHVGQ